MDHVPGGQLTPALKHWRQLPLQWEGGCGCAPCGLPGLPRTSISPRRDRACPVPLLLLVHPSSLTCSNLEAIDSVHHLLHVVRPCPPALSCLAGSPG